jgi:hypothetical protein
MAQATSPAASISAKTGCRSIASGVVRPASRNEPPTTLPTVPSRPHRRPSASRIARIRWAVVVLPFVPVIPTTVRRAVGSPEKRAAACAMAARTSCTRT